MGQRTVKILFIGDIVGKPGRQAVKRHLPTMRDRLDLDLVVANAENAAGGLGITKEIADEILKMGIDCLTSGNHIWAKKDIIPHLDGIPTLLRPANYPPSNPGRGVWTGQGARGDPMAVVNLMGRSFMVSLDCPFRTADAILEDLGKRHRIIIVDFHAEATAEKIAMGLYLDGRVSAVIGTHTHVTTADETILEKGTGYITDVGMTGPIRSVIGLKPSIALDRLMLQRPIKYEGAGGPARISALYLEINPENGQAATVRRIMVDDQQ